MKSVAADLRSAIEQGSANHVPLAAQSRIEIDPIALRNNLQAFIRTVAPASVIPVIKSNAYGHGIRLMAEFLQSSPRVFAVAVASLKEALTLRAWGIKKRLLVLSFFQDCSDQELVMARDAKIELPLYSVDDASRLQRLADRKSFRIHLKLDTGTTRIGLNAKDLFALSERVQASSNLDLRGVFTHFAESENADQAFTRLQLLRFRRFIARMRLSPNVLLHTACTAASLTQPRARGNAIRLGLGLYGLWPSIATKVIAPSHLDLQPVLTWKTKVLQVKSISAGTPVGYDRTFVADRPSTIAILPVGYYDGLDRKLSNLGSVLIQGQRCPIRGRICMNLTMVDVTDLCSPMAGDEVVLLGKQGGDAISADEMATWAETISYEIVTRLNPMIPRNWK